MTYPPRLLKLKSNFPVYAQLNLKIRTKSGKVVHLKLNKAQFYIHGKIEEQRKKTGKVRAIILKGRQQGCSTYVEGRLYWRTSLNNGVRAFILTHEEDATKNLFEMAQRYHINSVRQLTPSTTASNAKELIFDKLDSGYRVGTAGNKSVGRSSTVQFFHGSEVAFWPHAAEHAKGILQTIPDEVGTEVILESTANGLGNYFHQQWKLAEAGLSDFIAIFTPWYWQDEYRKPLPDGFSKTEEEQELADTYGLDDQQIYWRRMKIVELSANGADGLVAFKQEYPMNAAEAFQVTGGVTLITPESVLKARKNKVNGIGPLIVGVDPSRGGDRFAIMRRQGRKMYGAQKYVGAQVDKLGKQVSICKQILDDVDQTANKKPAMMFIDAGGGADLVDRLHELGYEDRVKAIAFGSTPLRTDKYKNKRGEMWGEMATWLKDEDMEVEVPDDDEVHADLCACPYDRDSHDRVILWRKEKIKEEYGFSPDFGDAGGLTFAEPVTERNEQITVPQAYSAFR
jgi:hypothetical protein